MGIKFSQRTAFILLISLLLLSSCSLTSSLQSNEKLLVKNKIIFEGRVKNKLKLSEELQLLTFQKPNAKLFYLFPLKLGIYNMANDDKRENKFKWWIKNKLGEPPVVFKDPLVLGSKSSMKNYLFNLGYLYNDIYTELKVKKQKITVKYFVKPNLKYNINDIKLPTPIDDLTRVINSVANKSILKKGDLLNINTLDEERIRISNALRDKGYYYFIKEYLSIEIDTSIRKNNRANLEIVVNSPKDPKGQDKFRINEVFIFTDYSVDRINDNLQLDTIDYEGYHFIFEKKHFEPKALLFGVFFKKGDSYSFENQIKTQRKIVSFGAFKFVNIDYKPSSVEGAIDAFLYLTPSKKQIFSGDVELSHSFEGLSGTSVSLTYSNRNLTKRSDLLRFKTSAGVELNLFDKKTNGLLNSADISTDLSYYVNRFIVPFPLKKVSKNSNVKTKFSLQYNFEKRIKRFTKHSTTFTAGYEWNETQTKKHFYNPISLSLLLIPNKDSLFQNQLDTTPSLKHSFEEKIIFGSSYTFLMTNKKGENDNSYFRFQGDVYLAGNFVHVAMLLAKKNSSDTIPYKILKKEYAQFARFEANIVQYNQVTAHSELVTRFNAGVIIPYGNSKFAPYFQQFYVGGANSVRAFRLRALGPGSYSNENSFDNKSAYYDLTGDLKLEANVEYRFDLYKWFKWAFFVDAGNVWTLKDDPDREGGVFKSDFYNSIAVGFGAGLRLDFSYFVIRTDLAMPLVDPRRLQGEKWRLSKEALGVNKWSQKNLIFNLAIGYPF